MGSEVAEMSKQLAISDKDKQFKEMMITQLRSEVESKEEEITKLQEENKKVKESEKSMEATV